MNAPATRRATVRGDSGAGSPSVVCASPRHQAAFGSHGSGVTVARSGIDGDVRQPGLQPALHRHHVAHRRGVVHRPAERQAVLERRGQLAEQHVPAAVHADHVGVGNPDDVHAVGPQALGQLPEVGGLGGLSALAGRGGVWSVRHGGSRHENVRIQTIFRSVTAPVRAGKVRQARCVQARSWPVRLAVVQRSARGRGDRVLLSADSDRAVLAAARAALALLRRPADRGVPHGPGPGRRAAARRRWRWPRTTPARLR